MEKRQSQTIISTVVIAVAAIGMLGGYAISNVSFDSQLNTLNNNAYMTGHVALTLTDVDGNIVDYRQTDNLITTNGENCASKSLFGGGTGTIGLGTASANSTDACLGAITEPFTVIAIGNNTATAGCFGAAAITTVGGGNVQLGCEHTDRPGFDRARDPVLTWTNATQNGAGSTAAKVVISNTFTNNGNGAIEVSESGVFNSTTLNTGGLFARQTFSTITVSSGDSLTVEWTINVGSAPSLDNPNQ